MAKKNFQVNLEGMIDLLSNHLYSSNQVFLRELLQNAVDAITQRQLQDPHFAPRVSISYVSDRQQGGVTILFEDNGIGLTESEVEEFLIRIGSSIKRQKEGVRNSFIGQFGIGLLSCFMVTDEIVMITQSIRAGYALEWKGQADGTYTCNRLSHRDLPGTSVYIRLKPELAGDFPAAMVQNRLRRFGGLLSYPIEFRENNEETIRLNYRKNPLFESFDDPKTEEEALLEFGREQFSNEFLAAIPLRLPSGTVRGVAFVRRRSHISSRPEHKVYLKGMLLSERVDNILPKWAFFLKAVILADHLQPTASRERFYQNDELQRTRRSLGRLIRNTLMDWHRHRPKLLTRIVEAHEANIKQMAEDDPEFLRVILPHLKFKTNRGMMSLWEIQKKSDGAVHYVFEQETYRQIKSFAKSMDLLIINARYDNDRKLLRRAAELDKTLHLQELEVQDLFERLGQVPENDSPHQEVVLSTLEEALEPYRCSVLLRQFEPAHTPTVVYLRPEARVGRTSDMAREDIPRRWRKLHQTFLSASRDRLGTLCLNYNNTMIQRLLDIRDPELLKLYGQLLYFQALLLGNYSLNPKELRAFTASLGEMIERHEGLE